MITTPNRTDTRDRILDIAQALLETRGFNAFSYQDIANYLGIKKASLHYHFPTKTELGVALAERHADHVQAILSDIDGQGLSVWDRLDAFIEPFAHFAQGCQHMCPGGMLAAEFTTLDPAIQTSMKRFFLTIHTWLIAVLDEGRSSGDFTFAGDAATKADCIISTLEGAILLSRVRQNADFLDALLYDMKSNLGG